MSNGNNSVITWRQVGVIIAMVGLFMTGGGILYTKADKTELVKTEKRCVERVDRLEKRVGEDIKEIKEKQNKTYDLLLQMKATGSIYAHEVE